MRRDAFLRFAVVISLVLVSAPARSQHIDTDGDGVHDPIDNCLVHANPNQEDADGDGFGTRCDADYDQDLYVGGIDFSAFVAELSKDCADPDFDARFDHFVDCEISVLDFSLLTALYDAPPGPSGLSCAGALSGCDQSVVDVDLDGFVNEEDNCVVVANATQLDSDGDGFGNRCDADFDDDGTVTEADFADFACAFGTAPYDPEFDLDGDLTVGGLDFGLLVAFSGLPPGPGLPDAQTGAPSERLGDDDGDGLENYRDSCRDVANSGEGQLDPDQDRFGLACDADYDQNGIVEQADIDLLVAAFGAQEGDPEFDPNMDHNLDGVIGAGDIYVWSDTQGGAPGPSDLPCVATIFLPPDAPDLGFRVARSGQLIGTVGGESQGVEVEIVSLPQFGDFTQLEPGGARFVYTPDSLATAPLDSFSYTLATSAGTSAPAEVQIELWDPSDGSFAAGALNANTLVVYNENAQDALEISQHYVSARGIDPSRICGVEMPNGLYAHKDQLLAARKEIVESCVCPAIPSAERPVPCEVGNLDAVAAVSPISHLVLIRGLPARLFGTGWPSDFMEPSLDYYLASLLYRDDEIFDCPGCDGLIPSTWMRSSPAPHARSATSASGSAYRSEIVPVRDRFVVYGRIEAMTKDRTMDLIDRTLDAEAVGFRGNVLSEAGTIFYASRDLTASFDPSCVDYTGPTAGTWPHATCRAGTTLTADPNPALQSGAIPGETNSLIGQAIDTGLFLGYIAFNEQTGVSVNGQRGFDRFSTMLNWRRSDVACEPLCVDAPDPSQCAEDSTDFFRELNTECVGGSPNLMGMQRRSYPVTGYGFFPPGWNNAGSGHVGKTPPQIRIGGGFQGGTFADDAYLHYGAHEVGADDASTCPDDTGQPVACPERLGITLQRDVFFSPALQVQGSREFSVKLRYRNQASSGGVLRVELEFTESSGGKHREQALIGLSTGQANWLEPGLARFDVADTEVSEISRLRLQILSEPTDGVVGWLDLDGIEVIDEATGGSLIPVDVGSFDVDAQDETHNGDYAANAIDRLGAIAWWGSSSHHHTGGGAFGQQMRTFRALFAGRSLGEAVTYASNAESGILYGDPLYRASASALYFPLEQRIYTNSTQVGSVNIPALHVTAENLPRYDLLYMNALHGFDQLNTVNWELATCSLLDAALCAGLWQVEETGTGSVYEHPIDWTQELIDPLVDQDLTVRLRVWNTGQEADALYDFAYLRYRANGSGI